MFLRPGNKTVKIIFGLVLSLFLMVFVFSFHFGFVKAIRLVVGSFYILCCPGLALTYVAFGSKGIDWLERVALSLALSISVVSLMVFYFSKMGIPINSLNVFLEITGLIVIALLFFWRRYYYSHKEGRR